MPEYNLGKVRFGMQAPLINTTAPLSSQVGQPLSGSVPLTTGSYYTSKVDVAGLNNIDFYVTPSVVTGVISVTGSLLAANGSTILTSSLGPALAANVTQKLSFGPLNGITTAQLSVWVSSSQALTLSVAEVAGK